MKGTIKRLLSDKGCGFIRAENGLELFFHKSALKNCKYEDLEEGREVEFEDGEGPKGPRAEDVYV